jgi:integrase
MMKIALFTGMRRGEIFKLRWEDLDFRRGFINIVEPKGGKSQKIPMNRAVREVFEAIPKRTDWIFPSRTGGPRKDANKDFLAIKLEAGLPADFRHMHGLRHLYATMLASSGQVDMFTLQKLLTHKSPQMTQRYAHMRDEVLRAAADKVDDILADAMAVVVLGEKTGIAK